MEKRSTQKSYGKIGPDHIHIRCAGIPTAETGLEFDKYLRPLGIFDDFRCAVVRTKQGWECQRAANAFSQFFGTEPCTECSTLGLFEALFQQGFACLCG